MKTLLKFTFSTLMVLCITNAAHSMERRESEDFREESPAAVPATFPNEIMARLVLIREFLITPAQIAGSDLSKYFALNIDSLRMASVLLNDQLDVLVTAAAEFGRCSTADINKDDVLELFFLQATQYVIATAQKMESELEAVILDDAANDAIATFKQVIKPWELSLTGPDQLLPLAVHILLQDESVALMTATTLKQELIAA